jgi:ketopantoate reductase
MAHAFEGAVGLSLTVEEDIWMKMWKKLLGIVAYRYLYTVQHAFRIHLCFSEHSVNIQ